jgi:hypothetical protein
VSPGRARSGSEFGHRDEDDSKDLPGGESRPDGRAKSIFCVSRQANAGGGRGAVKAVTREAATRGGRAAFRRRSVLPEVNRS